MTNQQPTALALTAGWTDAQVTLTNSDNRALFQAAATNAACGNYNTNTLTIYPNLSGGWWYRDYWYPYFQPVWTTDHKPIRLTMAEVESLRVAAKKDKSLKATLEKFTDHIEVVIDFE